MNVPGDMPIVCKNCGHTFTGKYCSNCGEKAYTTHDNTIIHLVEESAHFVTHLDGKFFNTLKTIFTTPGKLSKDYCNGIRKKYFKPISLFLLLVVIYLLFPVFEGLNMKLFYHMHNGLYGGYATRKIETLMQHTGVKFENLEEQFHAKGEKVSKFLLLLIIPATALVLQLLTINKRRLFFDQIIFATEINIFYLLGGFLILPAITTSTYFIVKFLTGKQIYLLDEWIGIIVSLMMIVFVTTAAKFFYSMRNTFSAFIFSLVFVTLYVLFMQFIYKFILFQVIYWQLH